jgi:phosphate transport system substrate-binding protein
MKSLSALFVVAFGLLSLHAQADPVLRLQCTPSLLPFAKDLVKPLKEQGIDVRIADVAGNTQVVNSLSSGEIEVALLTRRMKIDERVGAPDMRFSETVLGVQAVAVVVAKNVWDSGVHALKREQIARFYQNEASRWKEVGGEDRPMIFFEPAHEKGPWEIFATWLYGDIQRAPAVNWQVVNDGPDMQSALQFASGGISVGALRWADRRSAFPLGLIDDAGKTIDPTLENLADGSYPLMRPIVVIFPREPAQEKKKMLEFLVGEKGQKIIGAHDYVPQSALKKP